MKKTASMKIIYLAMTILSSSILTGCGIGGWWMNGNPNVGRTPFVPEMMYWKKEGISDSMRKNDWIN